VGERAGGIGLAQQPQLRLVEEIVRPVVGEREELERHHAARALVDCAVDARRGAAPELLLEAEMMEQLAGTEAPAARAAAGGMPVGRRRRFGHCGTGRLGFARVRIAGFPAGTARKASQPSAAIGIVRHARTGPLPPRSTDHKRATVAPEPGQAGFSKAYG
jgi:hypothetical protein